MSARYDLIGGRKSPARASKDRARARRLAMARDPDCKVSMKTVYRRIWEDRAKPCDLRRTKLRKGDLKELKDGSIGSKIKSQQAKKRLAENPELRAAFKRNQAVVASGGVPRKGENSLSAGW